MKVVKVLKSTLSSPLSSTGTSLVVKECVDSQDNTVALADFGTQSYFVVVIKQGDTTEIVKCSALTQNADGTATFTVASSGRNILPKSPYTGSSTGEDFQTGAEVIFTNDPLSMSTFANLQEDNTFTGANTHSGIETFTESAMPRISAQHTYGAGDEEKLATYRIVADTANAGAVDASTTQKGLAEEATSSEVNAGTAAGSAARLFVNPSALAASNYAGWLPTSDQKAALAGDVGTPGDSNRYVTAQSLVAAIAAALITSGVLNPPGAVLPYAGSSAPSGWLFCDGAAISRTTYATLFALIGTTYGVGNGSTTFNLPNLKGKVPVGYNASETEFDALGETGGEKTHTLTTAEIPAHTHPGTYSSTAGGGGGSNLAASTSSLGTVSSAVPTEGGNGAHNNIQPYLTLNYIVKI